MIPREKETFTGPLINAEAVQTFRESVEMVKKDGGRIITGGNVLRGGIFSHGYYVEPTLVSGLTRGHPLVTAGAVRTDPHHRYVPDPCRGD